MDLATPLTGSLIEWGVAALLEWYFNWRLLKAVKVDFVGLNYYFRVRVIMGVPLMINQLVPEKDRNDFGWEIYPYGMYLSLVRVARHKNVPIIVTENGVADRFDTKRANALSTTSSGSSRRDSRASMSVATTTGRFSITSSGRPERTRSSASSK